MRVQFKHSSAYKGSDHAQCWPCQQWPTSLITCTATYMGRANMSSTGCTHTLCLRAILQKSCTGHAVLSRRGPALQDAGRTQAGRRQDASGTVWDSYGTHMGPLWDPCKMHDSCKMCYCTPITRPRRLRTVPRVRSSMTYNTRHGI